MTSVLPSLSEKLKPLSSNSFPIVKRKENKIEAQNLINISFKILFAFAFMVFVLGVLFRDYLIKIIATEEYLIPSPIYSSSDAFVVVFFVILFYFISLVFIYTLVAAEEQARLLNINIIITIFNIV
jgi:O-antigen/teichoic acid export membrane protein